MFVLNRLPCYIYRNTLFSRQNYEILKRKIRRYRLQVCYELNNINYHQIIFILSHEIIIYIKSIRYRIKIHIRRYSKTIFNIDLREYNIGGRIIYHRKVNNIAVKKLYIGLKAIVRKKDNYKNYYRCL